MLEKIQRFGAAMFVPVLLFPFAGLFIGVIILLQNPIIFGSLTMPNTMWMKIIKILEEGGWTIFRNMPLIFAIGLPISLAKTAQARAVLSVLVAYLTYNYFVGAMLATWGDSFGVDFTQAVGGVSGLTNIAGIKTLDTSIVGAIAISGFVVYLHNKYFNTSLPDYLGVFQGASFVTIIAFFAMLPVAFLTVLVWPKVQHGMLLLQGFLINSSYVGVWIYTFLERILIPTGLHHFIYGPFIFGPAVVDGGIAKYWFENLSTFANTAGSLKDMFPAGGFALHGMSKIFGGVGIALAMYSTALPQNKRVVMGLLIPATLTSVIAGITEPLEFTFLFIAPVLFVVHSVLAATLATTLYAFGVVGNLGGGLLEALTANWIPIFALHYNVVIANILVGLTFTGIYFITFRYLIVKYNFLTPGRAPAKAEEIKLYNKEDFKNKNASKPANTGALTNKQKAKAILLALGGAENINTLTNCATRVRVSVKDTTLVADETVFKAEVKAHGLVKNGTAIQVIVGLSAAQIVEEINHLL